MAKHFCTLLLGAALILSGCAVKNDNTRVGFIGLSYHSNIEKLPDGNYTAAVEASPGRGRVTGAEALVAKDATDFCKQQNKAMKEVKSETDSHLLINGVAKLVFQCV
ncbi:hypothetical protein AB6825_14830 [Serratia proteamaculans]|jgi:hypothetical protein|uniref:hypothetical protein n=1 Tax=Serratia proteamaculans TaxID=28151 RepID=UPI0021772F5E|nr:hypothetical protein [Serratia proteamaculans]CAI1929757.1 Uncharacterised protein [Serratia proteamaculans]CAI1962352.1 Uncharacterised protein [Serratia proteamaculans]CAI2501873.1 Uncharacterised protein [Serratia proteamaculans]